MLISVKVDCQVLAKIEKSFTDKQGNVLPYYQVAIMQPDGVETVSCAKEGVFDLVTNGMQTVLVGSIDTKQNNKLRFTGVEQISSVPLKAAASNAAKTKKDN